MTQRRGVLGGLGAIVGGAPARRGLVVFSLALGTGAAVTGSCGSCTPDVPPVAPLPPPPPTMPTMDPWPPLPPISTVPEPPKPPSENPCVFVRPKAVRGEKRLPEARIVGGTPALPGEGQWMASLQDDGFHFCGGAVIAGRFVLTAAHCMGNPNFSVVVGRRDLRTQEGWEYSVTADDIMLAARLDAEGHAVPLYDPTVFDWDVALIDLQGPAGVDSLELYEGTLDGEDGKPKMARTWGWGRLRAGGPASPVLMRVDIRLVEQDACRASYDTLTPHMLCSDQVGAASCSGDSGGPLNVDGQRVGIVSYGIGCGDGWPGVYAYLGHAFEPAQVASSQLGYSGDLARWVRDCTAH